MREQIATGIAAYWEERFPALLNTLAHAARQVENLLDWEAESRRGYSDTTRLATAVGGFGKETLDLGALSAVLQRGHGSRVMATARHERLQRLQQELAAAIAGFGSTPPGPAEFELDAGAAALLEAYERHMTPFGHALRLARIARLEARGLYDPAEHDAAFGTFDWRRLDSSEMALCPPFIVYAKPGAHLGTQLGSLLELATSGRPVKLVVLHESWQPEGEETGRAAALRGMNDVTLLFLALRSVYFVQTSVASTTPIAQQVARALDSPRAAVISVYADAADASDFAERARGALASRAFPHFVYDPQKAPDFVSCLDISDNPEPEAQWIEQGLVYLDERGERQELRRRLTFADYAAGEAEFRGQFSPPQASESGKLVALADYLALDPNERWLHRPFVYALDAKRRLAQLVPSDAVLAHTTDRLHLWTTLQELSGVDNPFVRAAERRLRERLEAEKEQALAEQRERLEAQFEAERQTQVAEAMRRLAARLTGMAADLPAAAIAAAVTPPSPGRKPPPDREPAPPAAAPPKAEASEEPWIDQRLCTACDECITINKNLFAYDASKKAVIRDPRAGPYKDIVRAAEKCSSGAIHPGMPLDPSEKDLEKWVKRAQPYQ